MVQMAAIFVCMFASKYANNESWFILGSTVLCLTLMVFVPSFQTTNIFFPYLMIVMHALYGAVFISTFSTCLAKAVPLSLNCIGTGISLTGNNVMTFIMPLATGAIMGDKATRSDVDSCCWMLTVLAVVGVVAAIFLVINDRTLNVETLKKTDECLGVELLGDSGVAVEKRGSSDLETEVSEPSEDEARDVEALGRKEAVLGN